METHEPLTTGEKVEIAAFTLVLFVLLCLGVFGVVGIGYLVIRWLA